jgi:RNA polymerase sigma-70 factor (ECF subfamily)
VSDDTPTLLSDEPTVELIVRARAGDEQALEAILQRCLPGLRRWAHGRLPAFARGSADTEDLVQDAASRVIARLDVFEPRHVGAMQAYLRQSVINGIRDRIRQISRRPVPEELSEDLSSREASPLETCIEQESYERYRRALAGLRQRDCELVVARVEGHWTFEELSEGFGFHSESAARMAVLRALRRLRESFDALERPPGAASL